MPPQIGHGDPDVQEEVNRGQRGACGGCPQWEKCLFNMPRYGGFKGNKRKAPRVYVAYRLITDKAELNGAKEDFCTCENFVEVLQDRMLTGQSLRAEGKDGEVVTILTAQTHVSQRFKVGFNTANEIIRPMPNLIQPLKDAGYDINVNDFKDAHEFRDVTLNIPVPEYRERDTQDNYNQDVIERERKREALQEDAETAAWDAARARQLEQDKAMNIPKATPK